MKKHPFPIVVVVVVVGGILVALIEDILKIEAVDQSIPSFLHELAYALYGASIAWSSRVKKE